MKDKQLLKQITHHMDCIKTMLEDAVEEGKVEPLILHGDGKLWCDGKDVMYKNHLMHTEMSVAEEGEFPALKEWVSKL